MTVVIPAFNAERTIAETVRSALSSTYGSIEVVIVDDGSTDCTFEICEALAGADPRIRLVRRENGGLSAALNSGFAASRGEYVARLDADDLWHPEKLAKQMRLAAQRPEAAFIYTFVRYVDLQGQVVEDGPVQSFPPHSLCRSIYETIVGGGSSALMKRSAVLEAGGCDETFASLEDLLLQLKIAARAPIAVVPEFLVGYRIVPGSMSQNTRVMLRSWSRLLELSRKWFPQVPSWVFDRAHGARCLQMAESFAWRGQFSVCSALLVTAMRFDPAWTAGVLKHRAARHLVRRIKPISETGTGPPFLKCDPDESFRTNSFDRMVERGYLHRLHEARVARITAIDRAIAGIPSG